MKTKNIPLLIMLFAGAATSIITLWLHYELIISLVVLLAVLCVFYIIGLIVKKVVDSFETAIKEQKIKEDEAKEGIVVEKESEEELEEKPLDN